MGRETVTPLEAARMLGKQNPEEYFAICEALELPVTYFYEQKIA